MTNVIRAAATAFLLLLPAPLFAHHGAFYKAVFAAIREADLDDVKELFSKAAWEGKCAASESKCTALSAADLQQRLKNGKVALLAENSSHDAERSKCVVMLKLRYPEKDSAVERIWLLAERADDDEYRNSNRRRDAWRIVRIVNDEKQAQTFFKHSLPGGW